MSAPQLLQPRFHVCTSIEQALSALDEIGFPAVIKASDSGGSLGVFGVNNLKEAKHAVAQIQQLTLDDGTASCREFLVEQRIDGPELGVQGVVDSHGRVFPLAMTQKTIDTGPQNNVFMERCHLACPGSDIPPQVADYVQAVITALGLKASAFQMDVRLSPSGPVVIEAGARMSGARVPQLIQKATGLDWADLALAAWAQEPLQLPSMTRRYSAGHFVSPPAAGQIHSYHLSLAGLALAPDEEIDTDFSIPTGNHAGGYQHVRDRVGFIQVTADSPDRVKHVLKAVRVTITMRSHQLNSTHPNHDH